MKEKLILAIAAGLTDSDTPQIIHNILNDIADIERICTGKPFPFKLTSVGISLLNDSCADILKKYMPKPKSKEWGVNLQGLMLDRVVANIANYNATYHPENT